MYKKLTKLLCVFAGVTVMLSGCQNSPDKNVVVGKTDYIYVSENVDSETIMPDEEDILSFTNSFTSTDESVNFKVDFSQNVSMNNMPVVQVVPHYLTVEDVKTVAYALFPHAEFYEAEPELSENYSKSEIQVKLQRWSEYASAEALDKLFGYSDSGRTLEIIKKFIENYTSKYEKAPATNPHIPCIWEWRKSSEYILTDEELIGADLSNDSDAISTQFVIDGIPYWFTATTRNRTDYKVNMISCYIYDGLSPRGIDEQIFRAKLCRTEKPTELQINHVVQKVEELLPMFNLGDWYIDKCYVECTEYGAEEEYMIYVKAVPVFEDTLVLRRPQISSLRNKESYAPNHYLTDAQFVFSANGELISFSLFTPLSVQEIKHNNTNAISLEDLMLRAQKNLELTDYYHYGFGRFVGMVKEDLQCNVTISDLQIGLSRIRVPNADDAYYYVPSLMLMGEAEYIGKESGKLYYEDQEPVCLIIINALDGSLINATNE